MWRAGNLRRGLDVKRGARTARALARPPRFDRPVFVLGIPRSGTSTLFHVLGAHPDLGSLGHEGHNIWRAFHHPRWHGWRSDAVGPGQVGAIERRFVPARFRAHFDQARFVEKTPENCLRIGYLLDLFPDAHFVVIHRDPADVLNSLINGWRDPAGRYRSYYVPEELHIPDYPHQYRWCFALIEGWRDQRSATVAHIALEQWSQLADGLVTGRGQVDPARWTEVHLEQLRARPEETLDRIFDRLDLAPHPAVRDRLTDLLVQPANALSPPREAKWRGDNPDTVGNRLEAMAPTARTLGYDFNPTSGVFEARSSLT